MSPESACAYGFCYINRAINHITSSSSSVSPSTPYLTTTPIHSTCAPGAAEADEGRTVSNSYYINWLYCPPVRSKQLKNKNKKWTIKKMCSNLAGPMAMRSNWN